MGALLIPIMFIFCWPLVLVIYGIPIMLGIMKGFMSSPGAMFVGAILFIWCCMF